MSQEEARISRCPICGAEEKHWVNDGWVSQDDPQTTYERIIARLRRAERQCDILQSQIDGMSQLKLIPNQLKAISEILILLSPPNT